MFSNQFSRNETQVTFISEIYDWTTSNISYTQCMNYLIEYVFQGGVYVKWIDDVRFIDKDSKINMKWQSILKNVLELLLLFGMVPYEIIEDKNDVKYNCINIPHILLGQFVVSIDTTTQKPKVVFFSGKKEYKVYVKDGQDPNPLTGSLRSDFISIFKEWKVIIEAEKNAADADYINTHPGLIIKSKSEKIDQTEISETEFYAIRDERTQRFINPNDNVKKVRNDNVRLEVFEAINFTSESKKHFERSNGIFFDENNPSQYFYRKNLWDQNVLVLPLNSELTHHQNIVPRSDLYQKRENLERSTCTAFGFPPEFLKQSNTSIRFKNASSQFEKKILSTIESKRQELKNFYSTLYYDLYGKEDNIIYASKIVENENETENKKYFDISKNALPRAYIEFPVHTPFSNDMELSDILNAYKSGLIKDNEASFLIRDKFKLLTEFENEPKDIKKNSVKKRKIIENDSESEQEK